MWQWSKLWIINCKNSDIPEWWSSGKSNFKRYRLWSLLDNFDQISSATSKDLGNIMLSPINKYWVAVVKNVCFTQTVWLVEVKIGKWKSGSCSNYFILISCIQEQSNTIFSQAAWPIGSKFRQSIHGNGFLLINWDQLGLLWLSKDS